MSSYLDSTGVTRLATDLKAKLAEKEHEHSAADVTSGTLPVERGGTGKATHTSNAVLTGNGTGAVGNLATASGALFATAANGAAQFGTLPVAQGGTGATTAAGAAENIVDGQAIEPASVAATGEVSAKSGTGASAVTHNLTDKAEDTRADNLEASIAPVESVTATANHAVDDYFMLGDVLMKATAAIATGEQITTSNATPATVQSQIDTLRDSVGWKVELFTVNPGSFSASEHKRVLIPFTTPSGYAAAAIKAYGTNHQTIQPYNVSFNADNVVIEAINIGTNDLLDPPRFFVYILFLRNSANG